MRTKPTLSPWEYNGVYVGHEGRIIAYVYGGDVGEAESIANAHLITAAPELLSALKETVRVLETNPKILNGGPARFAGLRAIARAEGALASVKPAKLPIATKPQSQQAKKPAIPDVIYVGD